MVVGCHSILVCRGLSCFSAESLTSLQTSPTQTKLGCWSPYMVGTLAGVRRYTWLSSRRFLEARTIKQEEVAVVIVLVMGSVRSVAKIWWCCWQQF